MESDGGVVLYNVKLRRDWAERPYFDNSRDRRHISQDAHRAFGGRQYQLAQLRDFFVSSGGGTVLVAGHRGVGKTATVDRALIDAEEAIKEEASARRNLLRAPLARIREWAGSGVPKQLIVLKLDFGQIARARTGTSPVSPDGEAANSDTPIEVDPRQVLVEIIKGLHKRLVLERNLTRAERDADVEASRLGVLRQLATLLKPTVTDEEGRPEPDPRVRSFLFDWIRSWRLHSMWAWKRRRRNLRYWDRVSALLSRAMLRSFNQTYREEYTSGSSDEVVRVTERKLSLNLAKPIALVASVIVFGFVVAANLNVAIPDVFRISAAVTSFLGVVATYAITTRRTLKTSDAANLVYGRDASPASLKRDVEEIVALLNSADAPRDFRIVVVLDELDKLENTAMLDSIIQSFKNLFTLNRCAFVFITDMEYFEYVRGEQAKAAQAMTYAPQHTFFTLKLVLPRPDSGEVVSFLEAIRAVPLTITEEKWLELVPYLVFEARGHFFDLLTILNELVTYVGDREPTLIVRRNRVSPLEVLRRGRFQRMVERVYEEEHYLGHQHDDLNNALMAELYGVFDNLAYTTFELPRHTPDRRSQEAEVRRGRARKRLIELLIATEALECINPGEKHGPVRLRWRRGLCSDPATSVVSPDDERQELARDLRVEVGRWTVLQAAKG